MLVSVHALIWGVLILSSFGLTTIWSTVPSLFLSQLFFIFLGVILLVAIYHLDLKLIFSFGKTIYILATTSLLLTILVGEMTRGSTRWIEFGPVRLQTSEIAKLFFSLYFAHFISLHSMKKIQNYLSYLFLLAVPVILVLIQPDLGSSLVLLALGWSMLIVSDLPRKTVFITILVSLIALLPIFYSLKPYQKDRLYSFVNPYSDPSGNGYNVIQSVIAVGSGKVIGLGVKQGTQSHLRFLPERHTDFIFASFAEEFGFLGSITLIGAYCLIAFFWIRLFAAQNNLRNRYLIIGIFSTFFFQTAVNIGMNLGILPVTGITLPLVSYGGSSIITTYCLIGLALNLNKKSSI